MAVSMVTAIDIVWFFTWSDVSMVGMSSLVAHSLYFVPWKNRNMSEVLSVVVGLSGRHVSYGVLNRLRPLR